MWVFFSLVDYYPIVTIPAGARSIEIQELQMSSSYLAVRNLNQKYYLTKDWTIDWPGKFYFAGTMFQYQRSFSHPERLSATGPTNETLVFEVSTLPFMPVVKLPTRALWGIISATVRGTQEHCVPIMLRITCMLMPEVFSSASLERASAYIQGVRLQLYWYSDSDF